MKINCKFCKTDFIWEDSKIDFNGSEVKCGNCQKKWFYETEESLLEKRLTQLDHHLNDRESELETSKGIHSEKIKKLENDLKNKQKELEKQKKLEDKILTYEKRITTTEKDIAEQVELENKVFRLEKELQKNSSEILDKNQNIEKKTNYLQMKVLANANRSKELQQLDETSNNSEKDENKKDVVNINEFEEIKKKITDKKMKKFQFWSG